MKKVIITATALCLLLAATSYAFGATGKQKLISLSDMASRIEKTYGALFELELGMRKNVVVYRADVITNDRRVRIVFDAVTGKEIGLQARRVLSKEEEDFIALYEFAASSTAPSSTPAASSSAPLVPSKEASALIAGIPLGTAGEIALAKTGGGTIEEIKLERERGRLIYDVEIRKNGVEHELEIDATSGEILKHRIGD